ncbi:unnamed protein product [Camellia sinensis]
MDRREVKEEEEEHEIVIVGGGICGLATALALHRKGVRSVVLEKSETLRATGAAIAIFEFSIAYILLLTIWPLDKYRAREVWLDKGSTKETSFGHGEARCLKRSDLINTLADALPPHTIHFGCQIVGVKLDALTSNPILQLLDGRCIVAKHARALQNPDLIIQSTLPLIDGFPPEIQQMIEDSDVESLSLTHVRYRAPWDLLLGKFRKGTVTVAGDAMHVMGPLLGQGGSAGLEDAIVLARCLYQKLSEVHQIQSRSQMMMHKVVEAMDQYVKERRMRVVRLSMQTYLTGLLVGPSSMLVKLASIVLMVIFFRNQNDHTTYDCGLL